MAVFSPEAHGIDDNDDEFGEAHAFDFQNWKRGELLGRGSYGSVFLGIQEHGIMFAAKRLESSHSEVQNDTMDALLEEVLLLKQLDHENIVRYLGCDLDDPSNVYLFMEYMPCGSLSGLTSKFGSLRESVVRAYTRQILNGLTYLHSFNITHRDIKGSNILVNERGVVKLADFGLATSVHKLCGKNTEGTPNWMAPEVICGSSYGLASDIWALGCVVVEMLTGFPPFHEHSNPYSLMFCVGRSHLRPPTPEGLSAEGADFLEKCFRRADDRPSAKELLSHPFVAQRRESPGLFRRRSSVSSRRSTTLLEGDSLDTPITPEISTRSPTESDISTPAVTPVVTPAVTASASDVSPLLPLLGGPTSDFEEASRQLSASLSVSDTATHDATHDGVLAEEDVAATNHSSHQNEGADDDEDLAGLSNLLGLLLRAYSTASTHHLSRDSSFDTPQLTEEGVSNSAGVEASDTSVCLSVPEIPVSDVLIPQNESDMSASSISETPEVLGNESDVFSFPDPAVQCDESEAASSHHESLELAAALPAGLYVEWCFEVTQSGFGNPNDAIAAANSLSFVVSSSSSLTDDHSVEFTLQTDVRSHHQPPFPPQS